MRRFRPQKHCAQAVQPHGYQMVEMLRNFLVAPVFANATGARRAGQDRAAPKGSLDAPKRFRIIQHRSDALTGINP
jgi:hypothetical protein